MQRFLAGRVMGVTVSLALVAGISFFYRHILHVNQTTVALSFLLAILAVSAVWGMAVSVAMSLVAVGGFNFFFFPPIWAFTLADPQNWVPLFSFLVFSIIGSPLSPRIPTETDEAPHRQPRHLRIAAFAAIAGCHQHARGDCH